MAGANGVLGKALDALRQEVAGLKRSLAADKGMHPDKDDDKDGDQHKAAGDDEEDKKKAKGNEDGKDKAKAEGDEDEKDGDDQVAKSVGWPLDMNRTMPGAEPIEKRDPSLDWGNDPDKVAAAAQG